MGRKKKSKANRSQPSSSAGSSRRTRSTADAIAAGVDACTNILRLLLISTRTDGLCQADAVVAALLRRGFTEYPNARALRIAVAEAFLSDIGLFFDFLPEKYQALSDGPAQYAKGIKDGHEWSGNIELVIIERLIDLPIHVFSFRAQTVTYFNGASAGPNGMMTTDFPTDPVVYKGDEDIRPVLLGYYDELHYVSLEEEGRRHLIPEPRSGSSNGSGSSATTRTTRTTRSKAKKEQPPANAATAVRTARTARSKSGQSGGNGAKAEDGGGEKEQPRRSGRRRANSEEEATGDCNGGGSCGKADCGGCDQPKQKKPKSSSKASDSSTMEVDDADSQLFEDAVEDEAFEDAMEEEQEEEEMPSTLWVPSTEPITSLGHVSVGSTLSVVWDKDGTEYAAMVTAKQHSIVTIEYVDDGIKENKDLATTKYRILCDSCGEVDEEEASTAHVDPTGKERNLCLCSQCNESQMAGNETVVDGELEWRLHVFFCVLRIHTHSFVPTSYCYTYLILFFSYFLVLTRCSIDSVTTLQTIRAINSFGRPVAPTKSRRSTILKISTFLVLTTAPSLPTGKTTTIRSSSRYGRNGSNSSRLLRRFLPSVANPSSLFRRGCLGALQPASSPVYLSSFFGSTFALRPSRMLSSNATRPQLPGGRIASLFYRPRGSSSVLLSVPCTGLP